MSKYHIVWVVTRIKLVCSNTTLSWILTLVMLSILMCTKFLPNDMKGIGCRKGCKHIFSEWKMCILIRWLQLIWIYSDSKLEFVFVKHCAPNHMLIVYKDSAIFKTSHLKFDTSSFNNFQDISITSFQWPNLQRAITQRRLLPIMWFIKFLCAGPSNGMLSLVRRLVLMKLASHCYSFIMGVCL